MPGLGPVATAPLADDETTNAVETSTIISSRIKVSRRTEARQTGDR